MIDLNYVSSPSYIEEWDFDTIKNQNILQLQEIFLRQRVDSEIKTILLSTAIDNDLNNTTDNLQNNSENNKIALILFEILKGVN